MSGKKSLAKGAQLSLKDAAPIGSRERSELKRTLSAKPAHGGEQSLGKRKSARPFYAKTSMHIVLKSSKAKGEWSLLHRKHRSQITSMIYVYAKRFKVNVINAANEGKHLHLLVRADERKPLADFLRVLAGRIAVTVTGARKYVKRVGKFWDSLCWSRLVNWGIDFNQTHDYIANTLNELASNQHLKTYRELLLKSIYLAEDEPVPLDLEGLLLAVRW